MANFYFDGGIDAANGNNERATVTIPEGYERVEIGYAGIDMFYWARNDSRWRPIDHKTAEPAKDFYSLIRPTAETAFRRRIDKGIEYLDETTPGWLDRINLVSLTMHSLSNCVLCQVDGCEYRESLDRRFENRYQAIGIAGTYAFSSLADPYSEPPLYDPVWDHATDLWWQAIERHKSEHILVSRVRRGLKFLDEKMPNWHFQIDTETLDVSNVGLCVCGQLGSWFGLYVPGAENLGLLSKEVFSEYRVLTRLWKKFICQRQGLPWQV